MLKHFKQAGLTLALVAAGTVAFAITTLAKASIFGPPPDPVPSTMDLMLLVLAPAAIFFILSLAFNRIKRRGKRLNDGSNSSTAAIGAGSASSGKAKPDDAGGDGGGDSGDSDGGCGGGSCSGS